MKAQPVTRDETIPATMKAWVLDDPEKLPLDQKPGHRANGFTTDGGFAEYAVNHVNTLVRVPDGMSDEEATLIVTAGTAVYGLDVLGGLVAGESLVVIGPGPIGLMSVAVGKA